MSGPVLIDSGTLRCQYCGNLAPRARLRELCAEPECVRAFDRDRYLKEAQARSGLDGSLDLRHVDDRFKARFWSKVGISEPESCWPWKNLRNNKDYGLFMVQRGYLTSASRVALALNVGALEPNTEACHTCDNPPCCNPSHLFAGTRSDNMRDCISKGRMPRRTPGQRWGSARLTEDEVRQIRAAFAAGAVRNHLARQYGVAFPTISKIVTGLTWGHIK